MGTRYNRSGGGSPPEPVVEEPVSFLKRLFGQPEPQKPRVRICMECGMPVAEHKEWCAILRGQNEMRLRAENDGKAIQN